MITMNCFIYGMLLCASVEAGFVNDTCHEVRLKTDSKTTAKVECINTTKIYDPMSQNGIYLWNAKYWGGETFACLCSCKLPSNLENGKVLSDVFLLHGEMLKYECNKDYEKTIKKNIFCYDGLLMMLPEHLNTTGIVLFRQKSVSGNFSYKLGGKIFDLWVNVSDNWSVPYNKLQQNQKVFQILGNESSLQYYICGREYCKLGYVDLSEEGLDGKSLGIKNLECKRHPNETTRIDPDSLSCQKIIGIVVAVPGISFLLYHVVIVVIIICIKEWEKMPGKKSGQSGNTIELKSLDEPAQPDANQEQIEQDVTRSLTIRDDKIETADE